MLEVNKGRIAIRSEPGVGFPEEPSAQDLLSSALVLARRQVWVVVLFAMLGASLGGILFFRVTPNFVADATLLIDTRKIEILQQPAVFSQMSLESSAAMESQVEILKSEKTALTVVKKLDLAEDPEFVRRGRGLIASLFGRLFPTDQEPTEEERTKRAVELLEKRLTVSRIGMCTPYRSVSN